MFKQQRKRHRPYRVKKTSLKDENIDRQIRVIHKAIALKLIAQPDLVETILVRLEQQRELGRIGYGEYLTWTSILSLINKHDEFVIAMLEDSSIMRKYRRRTPFVGILNEQERQAALEAEALGEIADLSVLF